MRLDERFRRAGCLALGLLSFAFFFAVGAAVSLVSGDLMMALQALVVAAVFAGFGVLVMRRRG
ncbi:MAG TPA: hypothetical protein VNA88_10615 [Candidatus Kapabacteria bacterium]|nr:hypothetical protein [Candidatus Kapabacteria bacterium]